MYTHSFQSSQSILPVRPSFIFHQLLLFLSSSLVGAFLLSLLLFSFSYFPSHTPSSPSLLFLPYLPLHSTNFLRPPLFLSLFQFLFPFLSLYIHFSFHVFPYTFHSLSPPVSLPFHTLPNVLIFFFFLSFLFPSIIQLFLYLPASRVLLSLLSLN